MIEPHDDIRGSMYSLEISLKHCCGNKSWISFGPIPHLIKLQFQLKSQELQRRNQAENSFKGKLRKFVGIAAVDHHKPSKKMKPEHYCPISFYFQW